MYRGYIKLYRCSLDKAWLSNSEYCALWIYCLLRANYKDREVLLDGKAKLIPAGSFVTSRPRICKDTGIERSKVERILKCFESEQQIKQEPHTKYRIISILNWQKFQCDEQGFEQQVSNNRATSEQQVSTDNKDKNIKNDKNKRFIPPTIEEVKSYCQERNNGIDAQYWVDKYIACGWVIGKNRTPMKDWKATIRTWEKNNNDKKEKMSDGYKPL